MSEENNSKVVVPISRSANRSGAQKRLSDVRKKRLAEVREASLSRLSNPITGEAKTASIDTTKNKDMAGTTSPMSLLREHESVRGLYVEGRLVIPPYDLLSLSMLPEYSSELYQCVEAMAANIEGYGHRFVSRVDKNEATPELTAKVDEEFASLTNFFEYCDVEEGFVALRLKTRFDIEANGNGYWEIIRDVGGRIAEFKHAPSHMMRIGHIEKKNTLVETPVLLMQPDKSVKVGKIKRYKRFRQYLQLAGSGEYSEPGGVTTSATPQSVWFKEFQDKRFFCKNTGREITDVKEVDKAKEEQTLANEMIHFALYNPRTPYGTPRYAGNMLGIYGDRASEEANYVTFENNNIPSMIVSVSNGQLTQGSIDRLDSFVESSVQGSDNYSKFLVMEAEGFVEGEDGGQIKVEIKPLTREQHTDAMFQNYSEANRDSTRRSFRLPPIIVGRADDYTRATADASMRLADEQVFAPARGVVDAFCNRRVMPELGYVYHKFRSNSPDTTDNSELVSILSSAEKTGGMTPAIARLFLSDILGQDLGQISPEINADIPFSLQMAEAVKNKADPTEPGQQLTALKMIDALTGGEDSEEVSKAMNGVSLIRSAVEKKLRRLATSNVEPHGHN